MITMKSFSIVFTIWAVFLLKQNTATAPPQYLAEVNNIVSQLSAKREIVKREKLFSQIKTILPMLTLFHVQKMKNTWQAVTTDEEVLKYSNELQPLLRQFNGFVEKAAEFDHLKAKDIKNPESLTALHGEMRNVLQQVSFDNLTEEKQIRAMKTLQKSLLDNGFETFSEETDQMLEEFSAEFNKYFNEYATSISSLEQEHAADLLQLHEKFIQETDRNRKLLALNDIIHSAGIKSHN